MPLFPSLPETAHLTDILALFPQHVESLMALTNQIMRDDGELSTANRELIAAYVSGLNACQFCFKSHRIYAEVFGIAPDLIDALIEDFDAAPIAPELRPLLSYAAKLTALPSRLVPADAQAVFDAGWSEKALFELIEVTGLFAMFNRIIEGAGVNFDYDNARTDQRPGQSPDQSRAYLDYAERVLSISAERAS